MRVFVYEGYVSAGGTFMAYQIGRLCHERFSTPVFIVGHSKPKETPFNYPYSFPVVSKETMMKSVRPDDLLICNPSFSKHLFGLRLPCRKLMYIQGINTFNVLDVFFTYYVSVSSFVQKWIQDLYHISTPVIHPYIKQDLFNKGVSWNERKDEILVLNYKNATEPFLDHLIIIYKRRYPTSRIKFRMIGRMPQKQLAEAFGKHKYYLTLTPVEGFGLPSLEAMASGCAVIGFDAFGGRDYFKPGENSYVVSYGNFNRLIDHIRFVEKNPEKAAQIAAAGITDARQFSKRKFDFEWHKYLKNNVFR